MLSMPLARWMSMSGKIRMLQLAHTLSTIFVIDAAMVRTLAMTVIRSIIQLLPLARLITLVTVLGVVA